MPQRVQSKPADGLSSGEATRKISHRCIIAVFTVAGEVQELLIGSLSLNRTRHSGRFGQKAVIVLRLERSLSGHVLTIAGDNDVLFLG